jgi:tRNA(fMet)-specific endonuclease VapC
MLDTNAVSLLLRSDPGMTRRVVAVPMGALCLSAITEGELRYGLARRPDARRLHRAVGEFLRRVDVLPWNTAVAAVYGKLRADLQRHGKTLVPLDLLIAAHALHAGTVLVTNDTAFRHIAGLRVEDWAG